MKNAKHHATIAGVGMYVPETVLTNEALSQRIGMSDAEIQSLTGIKERRIASSCQAASDLGAIAAERALADAGISASEIDLIIVSTGTADMQFPSTACLIQKKLGIKQIPAFDLGAGCTGFIYALATASQFLMTSLYRSVLVIGVEVPSKFINWEDRETSIVLADGAGAVVMRQTSLDSGILSIQLDADGAGSKHLFLPAGGSRIPATQQSVEEKLHTIKMNGQAVFKFAMRTVPKVTKQALQLAGIEQEDVALFIPHQANLRIIEAAARILEIPLEKIMINIDQYGNTADASIPIALFEALATGRVKPGDILVLTGFGAGLTWGSVVMRWDKPDH